MFRIVSFAIVVLCLPGAAQAVPAAVREACRPDAIKFCDSVIHDTAKRRACMQSHRAELSTRCIDAVRSSRMGGGGRRGLYSQASNQGAIRDCRMQFRGNRGGIKGKDKAGLIEGCYVQQTGKYPWQ
jgi:hypothetical protein